MPEHEHHGPREEHIDQDVLAKLGYEPRDTLVRAAGKTMIGVYALLAFGGIVSLVYFLVLLNPSRAEKGQAEARLRRLPPSPVIQPRPQMDLRQYEEQQTKLLEGYSWADKQAGVARIPISRAMNLIAQQGLPARPQRAGLAPNDQSGTPASARFSEQPVSGGPAMGGRPDVAPGVGPTRSGAPAAGQAQTGAPAGATTGSPTGTAPSGASVPTMGSGAGPSTGGTTGPAAGGATGEGGQGAP